MTSSTVFANTNQHGAGIAIQEAERARIAQEIHDELGGLLTGLKSPCWWRRCPRRPAAASISAPRWANGWCCSCRGGGVGGHEGLSKREFEVMVRLVAGEAVGAIGAALTLSPKTVSTYRSRIFDKLGLSSNAALTRYAMEEGLI
jgi:DNA-binding NarL/FixJ family response regulator